MLRAGDGDLADETRSLFRIGHVIDVHRLGAAYIAGVTLGSDADSVAVRDGMPELILPDGGHEAFPLEIAKWSRSSRPTSGSAGRRRARTSCR